MHPQQRLVGILPGRQQGFNLPLRSIELLDRLQVCLLSLHTTGMLDLVAASHASRTS